MQNETPVDVRFSNRPAGVKRFQTIHRCGVDVARGLVLLSGIGTKALPPWNSRTRRNDLWVGLAGRLTAGPSALQADGETRSVVTASSIRWRSARSQSDDEGVYCGWVHPGWFYMSDPRDRSAWTRQIIVTVVGALILFAAIAAWMGWLPLTPKNDLLRSLQRLNSEASPTLKPLTLAAAIIHGDHRAETTSRKVSMSEPHGDKGSQIVSKW